jgi:predicted transcriptional regulator
MTITLDLAPQVEAQLREKAAREGQDAEAVAHAVLAQALAWEVQERAEAAEGIQRGLDDFAAGRYSPASQVFADIRARHAIRD